MKNNNFFCELRNYVNLLMQCDKNYLLVGQV